MMLSAIIKRSAPIRQSIRLYTDSRSIQRARDPSARVIGTRARDELRKRSTRGAQPRYQSDDPKNHFEPFPFKVDEENKAEIVKRALMPLYDIPYDQQLSSKESHCRNALRLLGRELYNNGTPIRLDVSRLPCHVNPIVPASQLTRYRNKDELSLWHGHDMKTKTAGYMVFPVSKHGDTVCVEPNSCDIMTEAAIKTSDIIQDFMRNQAQLSICYRLGQDSGWRRFMLRTNHDDEMMVIGILNPRGLRVQEVINERDNYRDFMVSECEKRGVKLASLYYQPCPNHKCRHQDVPFELLHGVPALEEQIGNYKFLVSPESYLHQSRSGAVALYQSIRDTIEQCYSFNERKIKPFILDAHCGPGILSVNLADMAERIVGVDNSSQAIDDAKKNAQNNGVTNAEFICSNLEIVVERILEKYSRRDDDQDTLVVCDTPKTGLHRNAIDVLKQCQGVSKLVYITPKIDGRMATENLIELCSKSPDRHVQPFVPILAQPVDLYPHTESFQTIIAFERMPAKFE